MPRVRPKARLSSVTDIVERAIKAVHDQFDGALVAEWNIPADSAKVRNAMQVLPNRCRRCKKSIAGIHGNLCDCRTKIEQERCFLNPREALLELFRERCQGLSTSASLARFVEDITRIAIANTKDLKWVEDQLQRLLPSLRRVSRNWVIRVCSLLIHTDLLPAWFKDQRQVISEEDLRQVLSVGDTESELAALAVDIDQHFERAKKAALDRASVQTAQFVRPNPKGAPHRRARQDLVAAMIARVRSENPDESIEGICQILDQMRCPLRDGEQRAGFSNWHDAWKDPEYRNRIKRLISSIEPAAPKRRSKHMPTVTPLR
jgi:hypothetical protein